MYKLQNWYRKTSIRFKSYVFIDKIQLNSKYIKVKQNQKFERKSFSFFQVLYLIRNQIYKIELIKIWKIYNVFYILLVQQIIIEKSQIDKTVFLLIFEDDTSNNNNKIGKYKVMAISHSMVYVKKSETFIC